MRFDVADISNDGAAGMHNRSLAFGKCATVAGQREQFLHRLFSWSSHSDDSFSKSDGFPATRELSDFSIPSIPDYPDIFSPSSKHVARLQSRSSHHQFVSDFREELGWITTSTRDDLANEFGRLKSGRRT